MDRPTLELQIREAHGKLARDPYYKETGGMAVFVTEDGVVWTAVTSNRYPKMMLRVGHGFAGVYTSATLLDWMLEDALAVARQLHLLRPTPGARRHPQHHRARPCAS